TSRSRDDSGRQKPGGCPPGFTAHSQMNFDPTRSSSEENVMNLLQRILVVCGLVAVTALARAAAAEELKLPEGQGAIHYYRSDGGYDGWGLHVWESFQKKDEAGDEFAAKENSDRPLKGVTWFKPVGQSGKD